MMQEMEQLAQKVEAEIAADCEAFWAALKAADEALDRIRATGVQVQVGLPYGSHLPFSTSKLSLALHRSLRSRAPKGGSDA